MPHNSHHETNVMAGSTERGKTRGHSPTPTGRLTAPSPRSPHRSGFFGTGRCSVAPASPLHIVILYEIEDGRDERVKNEATDDMIKIARLRGLMCMIDPARGEYNEIDPSHCTGAGSRGGGTRRKASQEGGWVSV